MAEIPRTKYIYSEMSKFINKGRFNEPTKKMLRNFVGKLITNSEKLDYIINNISNYGMFAMLEVVIQFELYNINNIWQRLYNSCVDNNYIDCIMLIEFYSQTPKIE